MEQDIENDTSTTGELVTLPDFGWPFRTAEAIFEAIARLWKRIQTFCLENVLLRVLSQGFAILLLLYVAILWISVCYVRFPISPFGFWDIANWVLSFVGSIVWGPISVALAIGTLGMILFVCVYLCILFLLSVGFLLRVIWQLYRTRSNWITRFSSPMVVCVVLLIALSAFVEGTDRYWEDSIDSVKWLRLFLLAIGAWSALFCILLRKKSVADQSPRPILLWTIVLILVIGTFEYWQAGKDHEWYELHKDIRYHPSDPTAWINLALQYESQAIRLESEPGEEDHAPPDPTTSFKEALRCFNRAIELGSRDCETYLNRAKVADKLGRKEESVAYAKEAIRVCNSDSREATEDVAIMNEIMTRHLAQPTEQEIHDRQVSEERIDMLPPFVTWIFDYI